MLHLDWNLKLRFEFEFGMWKLKWKRKHKNKQKRKSSPELTWVISFPQPIDSAFLGTCVARFG
jgi:hypothetical protein